MNEPFCYYCVRKKWSVDLKLTSTDEGHDALQKIVPPLGYKTLKNLESTNHQTSSSHVTSPAAIQKEKKRQEVICKRKKSMAMGLATSPGRQMFMNAFMMYMSGKQLNMWSINVTTASIFTPLTGLLRLPTVFSKFEDVSGKVDLTMPKVIYIILNLFWLGVGLYKMSQMRLLPTTSADWSGRVVWKENMEISSIPPL